MTIAIFTMKRVRILVSLLVLIQGIFLSSCKSNDAGLKSNPIDSPIIIEVREVLEPDSRRLTFFCKTERIYPCSNFPVLSNVRRDANSVSIDFTAVGQTGICLTSLGPATTLLDLNTIANGYYELDLNNANLKNKGTLIVTESEITLLFLLKHGIEFVRETTKRVPSKTYWGTIGYSTLSSAVLAAEFLQKLSDNGAHFNKQAPGHYFYYEIDDSGDIAANANASGYYFLTAFIFQFDGDEAAFDNLILLEGKNYKEDLYINVETYKGEHINNWSN